MERTQYLIDTNAVIDYLGKKLPDQGMNFMHDVVNNYPAVSVITKIELLGYNTPEKYHKLLANFVNDLELLELTGEVVDECIVVRKTHKIKLPDAIIAATAMVYDLTLITRNEQDFKDIPGLKLVNPHKV